eukprot:scaffold140_cov247-Pinguiococcus_pyrenoidosus.AAC.13
MAYSTTARSSRMRFRSSCKRQERLTETRLTLGSAFSQASHTRFLPLRVDFRCFTGCCHRIEHGLARSHFRKRLAGERAGVHALPKLVKDPRALREGGPGAPINKQEGPSSLKSNSPEKRQHQHQQLWHLRENPKEASPVRIRAGAAQMHRRVRLEERRPDSRGRRTRHFTLAPLLGDSLASAPLTGRAL